MNNDQTYSKVLNSGKIISQFLLTYADIFSDLYFIRYHLTYVLPKSKVFPTQIKLLICILIYAILLERYETYKLLLKIDLYIKKYSTNKKVSSDVFLSKKEKFKAFLKILTLMEWVSFVQLNEKKWGKYLYKM